MVTLNKHFFTGNNRIYLVTASILFVVFVAYYCLILYLRIGTDLQVHAEMAINFFRADGNITPNFLYYFLVALLAAFSKYKMAYYVSSVILLSAAIALKFLVNVFYLRKLTLLSSRAVITAAIMLLFIFSLPGMNFFQNKDFYLGQLTPNVWHNSTIIFLAPFSIILFFETIHVIKAENSSRSQRLFIFSLIFVNALIKPSFLFTIIPVVFIFFVFRFLKTGYKRSITLFVPYAAGLLFIALEYFFIYTLNVHQSVLSSKEASSVIISPFEMWNHFSVNMPVALITSCLFPLIYIVYTKGAALRDQMVSLACINFLFAILIWILFIETGYRRYHGNFYWQVVTGNYLLFFSMLIHLLQQVKRGIITLTAGKILFGVFTVHFLWGVLYWIKIIWFHGYS